MENQKKRRMLRFTSILVVLALSFNFVGCKRFKVNKKIVLSDFAQEADTMEKSGKIVNQTYTNTAIGLTLEVSKDWTLYDQEWLYNATANGDEKASATKKQQMNNGALATLCYLVDATDVRHPRFANVFARPMESFSEKDVAEICKNLNSTKMLDYLPSNLKLDMEDTVINRVDGIDFYEIKFSFMGDDKYGNQEIYGCFSFFQCNEDIVIIYGYNTSGEIDFNSDLFTIKSLTED